jgi:hypothetical protein
MHIHDLRSTVRHHMEFLLPQPKKAAVENAPQMKAMPPFSMMVWPVM